jgi:hypothetical protein
MDFLKDKFVNSDFGVFISLGTFLGYVIYYSSAMGINMYYGIPSRFLDFGLQNLASNLLPIVIYVGCFYILYSGVRQVANSGYNIKMLSALFTFICLLSYPGMLLYNHFDCTFFTEDQWYYIQFVTYICLTIRVLTWEISPGMLFVIVAALIMFIFISKIWGFHESASKENYTILEKSNNQKYVVINSFKDMLIIEPVNLKTKVITPNFEFIELKSEKDNIIKLKVAHTGRLKVKGRNYFLKKSILWRF